MFSATRFVLAGALVAVFGGFLVLGALSPAIPPEPYPMTGSQGTSADVARRGKDEFTGRLSIGGRVWGGGPPGVVRYRYRADEISDPRLEGEYVLSYTESFVDFGDFLTPLYHASFRIENEEGAWQEKPNFTLEYPDGTASSRTSALIGERAYAGMTAIAEITYIPAGHFEIRGVIIDHALPVAPDLSTLD